MTASAEQMERPSSLVVWLLASRPKTLTAAVAPVLVGAAVAMRVGGFHAVAVLAALVGAVAIQIATNFVNDLSDFQKGADGDDRLGPIRAAAAGWLSVGALKVGTAVAFLVAMLAGLLLTYLAGPIVVVIGIASILSGVAYTAGPAPLAYVGLGDVFVMVFFGFVAVLGTVFVQAAQVDVVAVLAAVPVGAIATAILAVNNLRDREQDARVNKNTLAVRFGERFAVGEYRVLLAAAYGAPVVLVATGLTSYAVLAPLLSAPLALKLGRGIGQKRGRDLNPMLGQTGQLLLIFSALFAVGLALS